MGSAVTATHSRRMGSRISRSDVKLVQTLGVQFLNLWIWRPPGERSSDSVHMVIVSLTCYQKPFCGLFRLPNDWFSVGPATPYPIPRLKRFLPDRPLLQFRRQRQIALGVTHPGDETTGNSLQTYLGAHERTRQHRAGHVLSTPVDGVQYG